MLSLTLAEVLRDHGVDFFDQAQFIDHARHQAVMVKRVTRVGVIDGSARKVGGRHRSIRSEMRNCSKGGCGMTVKGNADLSAYFFLRVGYLLCVNGMAGLLATNTIAQGDTREVGLDQLAAMGFRIPRAVSSSPWPGEAALEVSHVWLHRGFWAGEFNLDHASVIGITPFLTSPGRLQGNPYRLKANENKS